MKIYRFFVVIALCLFVYGCADMDIPKPKQFLKDPLGEASLELGMSKEEVITVYGEPDLVDTVTSSAWNGSREEWSYLATYSSLPVGAGHLSEGIYLYFDGDSLTNISRKSMGEIDKE